MTSEGEATDINVAKSPGLGLEKTIEIVRKWRFKPATGYAGRAAKLFLIATVAVTALTAVLFFGKTDTNAMSPEARLPLAVLGPVGPIALFFLWFSMWRYWVPLDRSSSGTKRFWFLVPLFGFW